MEQASSGADRAGVVCIVLGRGADVERVLGWVEVAAPVPGFVGFAVGRTELASRGEAFAERVMSATRFRFGGHVERRP